MRTQSNLRHLPVIVFSSSAQAKDIEKASLLGANSYVVKCSTVAERVEFARAIRAFWLHFHRPPPSAG